MTLITIQTQKTNKDPSGSLKESGDEEGGGERERERKRELSENSRIPAGSLSVFWPQIRPSVGFGRIRPDLSNPRTYTGVGLTDPVENQLSTYSHEFPSSYSSRPSRSRHPSSIAGRRKEEERSRERERESSKRDRERWGFVLKSELMVLF